VRGRESEGVCKRGRLIACLVCRRRERVDKEAKRLEREAEEEAARQVKRKDIWTER